MLRMGARLVGAGAVGFGVGCAWNLGQEVRAESSELFTPGLNGRVWPPPVMLEGQKKGTLPSIPIAFANEPMSTSPTSGGLTGTWKLFKLEEVLPINHNTSKFIFSFDDPETEYELPPCSTVELGLRLSNGRGIKRLYTPITQNKTKGGFELIVKHYSHGAFTPLLFKMKPGEFAFGKMKHLKLKYKKGVYKNVGLIAGGTGIAPMLQVIRAVLSDDSDEAKVSLLFCNRRQRDILMKAELDDLQAKYPNRFQVTYCLQQPPLGWEGEVGKVTHAMVARTMPPPNTNSCICLSGPDKMMEIVGGANLSVSFLWRNTNDNNTAELRAHQVAHPHANNQGSMKQGILYECGYNDFEVYRF